MVCSPAEDDHASVLRRRRPGRRGWHLHGVPHVPLDVRGRGPVIATLGKRHGLLRCTTAADVGTAVNGRLERPSRRTSLIWSGVRKSPVSGCTYPRSAVVVSWIWATT